MSSFLDTSLLTPSASPVIETLPLSQRLLVQARDILGQPQLEGAARLIVRQVQEPLLQRLLLGQLVEEEEGLHVRGQQGLGRVEVAQRGLCGIEGFLGKEADALGQRVDRRRQLVRAGVVVVVEPNGDARRPVNRLGREHVFERQASVDQGGQVQLAASARRETEAVLEEAYARFRPRVPNVHLDHKFEPTANGAAVDFGNEGGRGDVLE